MKINNEQLLSSLYRITTRTAVKGDPPLGTTTGAAAQVFDNVVLSGNNSHVDKLKSMMAQPSDSQSGKVAQLKQQISDGSYQVDASATAGKMLDNWRWYNA